jgi:hypothetical protein
VELELQGLVELLVLVQAVQAGLQVRLERHLRVERQDLVVQAVRQVQQELQEPLGLQGLLGQEQAVLQGHRELLVLQELAERQVPLEVLVLQGLRERQERVHLVHLGLVELLVPLVVLVLLELVVRQELLVVLEVLVLQEPAEHLEYLVMVQAELLEPAGQLALLVVLELLERVELRVPELAVRLEQAEQQEVLALTVQMELQGQAVLRARQVLAVPIQALQELQVPAVLRERQAHLVLAVFQEQELIIRGRGLIAQERHIQLINAYRITEQGMYVYLPERVNSLTSLLLTGMYSARQVRAEQLAQLVLQELQVRAELQVLQEPLELLGLVRQELLERVAHLVKLGLQVQLAVEVHQGQAVPREQAAHPVHLELEHLAHLEQ